MKNLITFGFEKFNIEKTNPDFYEIIWSPRDNIGNLIGSDSNIFRFSQVLDTIFHYYINRRGQVELLVKLDHIDENYTGNYIIPTAVAYNPDDWTDKQPNKKSVFDHLCPKFLSDLQQGKAMLLIDQSVEGYTTDWLWKWFHDSCKKYNINPKAIIYFTGDQKCNESYKKWCFSQLMKPQLNVFPSISLSMYVYQHYVRKNINLNFHEVFEYKKSNKENLFLYDCTNMRPRMQRILNFLHLANADLLNFGNISMPKKSDWKNYVILDNTFLTRFKLPLDIEKKIDDEERCTVYTDSKVTEHYWQFVERIHHNMYKNSWVSLITESSYFQSEGSVFISEKTFKPIASLQPFIIVGSKHTLRYLRKLGYKTFHPYIDESYDDVDDKNRFLAIIDALMKIQKIEDKVSWLKSMEEILQHNQDLFLKTTQVESQEYKEIQDCYRRYFGDIYV